MFSTWIRMLCRCTFKKGRRCFAVAIAYTYGWRMQSEVLTLERRQLDLEAGTLRLDPGSTKNDEGRVIYLTPEVKALLGA